MRPRHKEKHFMITELKFDEQDKVVHCLLEAVMSKRSEAIDWQQLKNPDNWLTGWK